MSLYPSNPPIAQKPAEPRDNSKLLVYNSARDKVEIDRFKNIDAYLPHDSFLVLNKTKVLPARVIVRKKTGGKVEVLFLINELRPEDKHIKALADRKVSIGQRLFLNDDFSFECVAQDGKIFYFEPSFPMRHLPEVLLKFGTTPIPKYIRKTPLKENMLRKKYQSIFARSLGSVAAPTASLHFTPGVLKKLAEKNIPRAFVTLHVGLGTFSPVTEENMRQKKLFTEYYDIGKKEAEKIMRHRNTGRKLIAVGTTTVRTLESAASTSDAFSLAHGNSSTELFISAPYVFRAVDGLITNFHLKGSSLLMLVEAFLKHKKARRELADLYQIAVREKFRFYSFGDAMLLL